MPLAGCTARNNDVASGNETHSGMFTFDASTRPESESSSAKLAALLLFSVNALSQNGSTRECVHTPRRKRVLQRSTWQWNRATGDWPLLK